MLSPYDPPPQTTGTYLVLLSALAAWAFAVWLAITHSALPDLLTK